MKKLLLLISTVTFAFQLYAQVNVNIEDVVETGLDIGDPVSAWISVSDLTGQGIFSFQFTITYDTALVNATGINTLGDIDFSGWTVLPNINVPGEILGAGFGATVLTGNGNFIELLFEVVDPEGYTDLTATEFLFNAGTPIALVNNGSITLEANQPPELDPIGDQSMNEGDILDVPVNATDPDGDNITLTLENSPTFTAFVDNGNGTGTITFAPATGDSGIYPNIRVIATDDGTPSLTDTIFFTLSVGIALITDPSNLTVTVLVENEVELNWTDNSDNEDGFIIEREIPGIVTYVVLDSVGTNITTYTDASVLDGERYNYRIKAFNGYTQSDYTNPVQIVTILPAPTSLGGQVTSGPPWIIEMNWQDNSDNEDGFVIERELENSGFVAIDTVGNNITQYVDTIAVIDTFNYRVYAFTEDTVSNYSNEIEILTPVELTSFTASISGNSIDLFWTTSTELNNGGFEVQRMLDKDWEIITFIKGMGTTIEENNYKYTDNLKYVSVKGIVKYRLKQIDYNANFKYSDIIQIDVNFTPREYLLFQNYPNPFNPSTKIEFALPENSKVNMTIYNSIGEVISVLLNEEIEKGYHEINFNAFNLGSGIYFYRLHANEFVDVKKMILLK